MIDTEALAHAIETAGGPRVGGGWKEVGGGCIHTAGRLGDEHGPAVFVKINSGNHLAGFEAEADALTALAACGRVRVPGVAASGRLDDGRAFLALEWIPMTPRTEAADRALGTALASQHDAPPPEELGGRGYGWPRDNFIGATPQPNPFTESWAEFFRQQRLRPQLELLARRDEGRATIGWPIARLYQASDIILRDHQPRPSLLHGDLWGGNAAAAEPDAEPVLFDPATYLGDAETDIAFSRMFGGFSPVFYRAYHGQLPPAPGAELRARLYNLYHLLNHANLFGGHYLSEARSAVARLVGLAGC